MAQEEFTSFADPTFVPKQGGMVEYGGGDKGMVAMFYYRPTHNPAKSQDAGRPFFEDVVYVRIHPPGERLNIIDRPAKGDDSRRWPQQWAQFNQNKQQMPEGTPIDMLYPDYPSVAAMLRAHGVHTVEQCADLSGPAIDNIGMGAQRYCNDSRRYLEMSNKGVKAGQFRQEMEEKDREIKLLKKQVEDLIGTVDQLKAHGQAGANMEQIQSLLAGMMNRPTHMLTKQFDPQTAMINSTSTHAQETARTRAPKRSRNKLA